MAANVTIAGHFRVEFHVTNQSGHPVTGHTFISYHAAGPPQVILAGLEQAAMMALQRPDASNNAKPLPRDVQVVHLVVHWTDSTPTEVTVANVGSVFGYIDASKRVSRLASRACREGQVRSGWPDVVLLKGVTACVLACSLARGGEGFKGGGDSCNSEDRSHFHITVQLPMAQYLLGVGKIGANFGMRLWIWVGASWMEHAA